MEISIAKTKAMHIHQKIKVSETTEEEIASMGFVHICPNCEREFPTKRGLAIHQGRWCDGGMTVRSRKGSLADKTVQKKKHIEQESKRTCVTMKVNHLKMFILSSILEVGYSVMVMRGQTLNTEWQ